MADPDRSSTSPGDVPARRGSGRRSAPLGGLAAARRPGPAARWLSIFGASLTLLLIRLLVPVPVGQADNRDGPRLMCGFGLRSACPRAGPDTRATTTETGCPSATTRSIRATRTS